MKPRRPRHWPLHPPPAPGEALSSWLARLATHYGLSVRQLLEHNLGPASALAADVGEKELDWDPPLRLLEALAERTGTSVADLRLMTIGGWVPWLADTLDPEHGPEAFHTYVRQDSVLLGPGETGTNVVQQWLPWLPVDRVRQNAPRRVCPVCATDPDRGVPLTAGLLLMLSCPDHQCLLEPEVPVRVGQARGEPVAARPAPEPVAAVDRLTWEALTTGMVTLPARPVHVGLWLRLLRTLVDEVTISTSQVRAASARTLDRIWEASGWPLRGGITVWRPYEQLRSHQQDAVLTAAATAVHLIRTGKITAGGTLGPLLTIQPRQSVDDGEPPGTTGAPWSQFHRDAEAVFQAARTESGIARQLLTLFTHHCRTLADFDRERRFLIDQGIPEALIPDARELGRLDLA